jgi:hypothetical protein
MSKGNPNPSPETRFSADNPGRAKQKGARDRMSTAFLNALADDFEAHGKDVVATVREKDPSTYIRVFASLAPKEIEISSPLDELSDGELATIVQVLTEALRAQVPPAEPEEAPRLN